MGLHEGGGGGGDCSWAKGALVYYCMISAPLYDKHPQRAAAVAQHLRAKSIRGQHKTPPPPP